jgi:flap endonuclease-1
VFRSRVELINAAYRAAQKAAAAEEESEQEDIMEDQPAPTSDFEVPDHVNDEAEEGADAEKEDKHSEDEEEEQSKKSKAKAKAKSGKGKSKKGGKAAEDDTETKPKPKKAKAKGGVQIPEHWPWEEAKKLFEKPDVLPADQVEVRHPCILWRSGIHTYLARMEKSRRRRSC